MLKQLFQEQENYSNKNMDLQKGMKTTEYTSISNYPELL